MMNRIPYGILMALCISVSGLNAQNSQKGLDSDYQIKIGDYAALIFSELLKTHSELDAPTVITYEPDLKVIDIEIIGGRGTAEGAKETIQNYLQFIHTSHVPYVRKRFGLTLTDDDFRVFYYDRSWNKAPKLIITYANGQYTLPPE